MRTSARRGSGRRRLSEHAWGCTTIVHQLITYDMSTMAVSSTHSGAGSGPSSAQQSSIPRTSSFRHSDRLCFSMAALLSASASSSVSKYPSTVFHFLPLPSIWAFYCITVRSQDTPTNVVSRGGGNFPPPAATRSVTADSCVTG